MFSLHKLFQERKLRSANLGDMADRLETKKKLKNALQDRKTTIHEAENNPGIFGIFRIFGVFRGRGSRFSFLVFELSEQL